MRSLLLMLLIAIPAPALAAEPEPVFDGKPASEWADGINADGAQEGWHDGMAMPLTSRLQLGREKAFPVIEALLRDPRPRVRALTCQNVLGRMGPRSRHLYADPVANRAVRRLLAMLEDRDAQVRGCAIVGLDRMQMNARLHFTRPPVDTMSGDVANSTAFMETPRRGPLLLEARRRLIEMEKDTSKEVRATAAEVRYKLEGNGWSSAPTEETSIPGLIGKLRYPGWMHAQWAAEELGRRAEEAGSAVPALVVALKTRANLRKAAMTTLGLIGPKAESALPEIRRVLERKLRSDRAVAALALWRITGEAEESIEVLREILGGRNIQGLWCALQAAGQMGDAAAELCPEVRRLLDHESCRIRQGALAAFRILSDDRDAVIAAHVVALEEKDPYIRITAARGLCLLGDPPDAALPGLERLLTESLIYAGVHAAYTIRLMGPRGADAAGALHRELRDTCATVRGEVIPALLAIGEKGIECLVLSTTDERPWVRGEVAVGLGEIGDPPPAVRVALERLLGDLSFYVRMEAAVAIARSTPDAAGSMLTIFAALRSKDRFDRQLAAGALLRLGPGRVWEWLGAWTAFSRETQHVIVQEILQRPEEEVASLRETLTRLSEAEDKRTRSIARAFNSLIEQLR